MRKIQGYSPQSSFITVVGADNQDSHQVSPNYNPRANISHGSGFAGSP